MRLHRFYLGTSFIDKEKINTSLNKELCHQLRSVFRLHTGSRLIFFDDSQSEYVSEIVSLSKNELTFHVIEKREVKPFTSLNLTLVFSLIKKDNVELILEKGTEIGVKEFIPIVSDRSEKKGFNIERAHKKIIEATEQSGRVDVPLLRETISFEDFISNETRTVVMFHTQEGDDKEKNGKENNFKLSDEKDVVACIGPEGGWSEKEIELCKKKGVHIVHLDSPVLRAETAAIAISSILLLRL